MKNIKILFFGLMTLALTSCSPNLSSNEALKLLKEKYDGNGCYGYTIEKTKENWNNHGNNIQKMKSLESQGLIKMNETLKEQRTLIGRGTGIYETIYDWKPTEKASQFKHAKSNSKYKLTTIEVTRIDGISVSKETNTATVRFTYVRRATPFYELASNQKNCDIGTFEGEEKFQLFDSGWQSK